MVPRGWDRLPLEKVAQVRTGLSLGKKTLEDPIDIPYLRVANVQDGWLDLKHLKEVQIDRRQLDRYSLKQGDVLMTEGGDFDKLGRGHVWDGSISPCLHQNHVFSVRTGKLLDPYFSSALAGSGYGKSYFLYCAKKSTNLASINATQLKEFPVLLPPVPEQLEIVRVLGTWDRALDVQSRLIRSAIQQKKALAQQLLTGKRRLPGFCDDWRHVHLGDVCERVTRKNGAGIGNVLTISAQHGLVSQQDYFNKPVASSDLSKYTHLKRGDFAYNKSYSKGFPMGAIKELSLYDEGVVSSLYICFRRKRHGLGEQVFLRHFVESGMLNREIYAFAQEGARNHGLLNIAVGDYSIAG
jgi:type I restriction enzyme S subunit